MRYLLIILCVCASVPLAAASSAISLNGIQDLIAEKTIFQFDERKSRAEAIRGLLKTLNDPYAYYFDAPAYQKLQNKLNGKEFDIGIRVKKQGQKWIITQIFDGSPADTSSLELNQELTHINGDAIQEWSESQIYAALLGIPNSVVRLQTRQGGISKSLNTQILRKPYQTTMIPRYDILDFGVAYLQISHFDDAEPFEAFEKVMAYFKNANATNLILDLRHNTGGNFKRAIDIANSFLPAKTVLGYVNHRNAIRPLYAQEGTLFQPNKIVIIINEHTASSAEILASILRTYFKSSIMGVQSEGKAYIQKLYPLDQNDAILLTISEYLPPNKRSFQKIGLKPDIIVQDAKSYPKDQDMAILYALHHIKTWDDPTP